MRALEERVGVRLLQRTTRSVGLTEAGARFLARLKPAMASMQNALDELGQLRDSLAGTLRLTLPSVAYEQVLAPKLPQFLAAYPEIKLDMSVEDANVDIVEHGFDAGFRIGRLLDREMIGVRVSQDLRMAIVGSPVDLAARGTPLRPVDLRAHECLLYRSRTTGEIYRWQLVAGGRTVVVAVDGRIVMDNGDLAVLAALDGIGLACVLEEQVQRHLDEGRLVRVLESYCPTFARFYLYYPSRALLAPKLKALIDFYRVRVLRKADLRRALVQDPALRPRAAADDRSEARGLSPGAPT